MTTKTNAIITASYAPDFERCRILCESMDAHASGYTCHYILVDGPDVELFSQLAGPKRKIIADTELLPWWLRRLPQSISPKGRRVWVGPRTVPLHGWHVQQIMRIAIAAHIKEDGLLYCDSDTAFIKDYDLSAMWRGDDMRLWRRTDGALTARNDHMFWVDHASHALGIPKAEGVLHNYVCSFVTWKRQAVLDMCARIEKTHGKHWISVVGAKRKFSECMLYGAYVDAVLAGSGHYSSEVELCPMQWFDPAPSDEEMRDLVSGLGEGQVAMGVQSFIPMDAKRFRDAVFGADAKAA